MWKLLIISGVALSLAFAILWTTGAQQADAAVVCEYVYNEVTNMEERVCRYVPDPTATPKPKRPTATPKPPTVKPTRYVPILIQKPTTRRPTPVPPTATPIPPTPTVKPTQVRRTPPPSTRARPTARPSCSGRWVFDGVDWECVKTPRRARATPKPPTPSPTATPVPPTPILIRPPRAYRVDPGLPKEDPTPEPTPPSTRGVCPTPATARPGNPPTATPLPQWDPCAPFPRPTVPPIPTVEPKPKPQPVAKPETVTPVPVCPPLDLDCICPNERDRDGGAYEGSCDCWENPACKAYTSLNPTTEPTPRSEILAGRPSRTKQNPTPIPTNTPQPTATPLPTATPVPPTATPMPAGYCSSSTTTADVRRAKNDRNAGLISHDQFRAVVTCWHNSRRN